MKILIHTIETDGLQTRAGMNEDVVSDYADIMRGGGTLPPITLYTKDPNAPHELGVGLTPVYYLADGFHRLEAAKRLGYIEIDAEVREGDKTAALKCALKANAAHGLRRTNADKRHALEIAWENRNAVFGGEPSKRQLAEACAVSDFLAWDFINERKVVENTTSDFDLIEERPERSTTHEERSTTHDVDRFGTPIPEHLVSALKSKALAKMSRQIRALAAEITRRQEARDYVFAKISQSTMIALQNAANDLKLETPYCVCPNCKGEGCRACGKIGLQTKMEYERNPSEVRAC